MTAGQRWAYLAGAMQWYGDLLGLVFFIFLLAGAANLATGGGQLFRKLTVFLVSAVPVMVLLGLVRAVALLRRGTGASWRDAIGAFFIWQSTSLVVARASVLALFAKKAAFLRTPKTSEQTNWWEALRANWAESTLALFGFAAIAGALTKADPAERPAAGRRCRCSRRSAWPRRRSTAGPRAGPRCRRPCVERRTTEWRRTTREAGPWCAARRSGGLVTVLGVIVAAVALLLVPSHHSVQPPPLVALAQSSPTASPTPSPTAPATPSPTPSSTTPSPTPTPSPRPPRRQPPRLPRRRARPRPRQRRRKRPSVDGEVVRAGRTGR